MKKCPRFRRKLWSYALWHGTSATRNSPLVVSFDLCFRHISGFRLRAFLSDVNRFSHSLARCWFSVAEHFVRRITTLNRDVVRLHLSNPVECNRMPVALVPHTPHGPHHKQTNEINFLCEKEKQNIENRENVNQIRRCILLVAIDVCVLCFLWLISCA